MAKYYKLGEKALEGSFFDPTSQLQIRGAEVVKVERLMKTKKTSVAINQGHIILATEQEYNAYTSGQPLEKHIETPKPKAESELTKLTDVEFKKAVKDFGFNKKDKDAIMACEDRNAAIMLYETLSKKYEE